MKKQIKYPSQDDVQILIDIMNRQNIYDGAAKGEFKKLAQQVNSLPKNWTKLHDMAFGAKSPWDYYFDFTKNNRRILIWNKVKAKSLGLDNL